MCFGGPGVIFTGCRTFFLSAPVCKNPHNLSSCTSHASEIVSAHQFPFSVVFEANWPKCSPVKAPRGPRSGPREPQPHADARGTHRALRLLLTPHGQRALERDDGLRPVPPGGLPCGEGGGEEDTKRREVEVHKECSVDFPCWMSFVQQDVEGKLIQEWFFDLEP